MRRFIIFVAAICSASAAHAGAFGIEMGTAIKDLHVSRIVQADLYEIKVPNPYPEFVEYFAIATKGSGVCKILGIGKNYRNDPYGEAVLSSYSTIKGQLTNKYGSYKEFDFLKDGAIWTAPREWVESLLHNERVKTTFWNNQTGAHLPSGIQSINIDIKAVRQDVTYVSLSYEFSNFGKCKSEMTAEQEQGL